MRACVYPAEKLPSGVFSGKLGTPFSESGSAINCDRNIVEKLQSITPGTY